MLLFALKQRPHHRTDQVVQIPQNNRYQKHICEQIPPCVSGRLISIEALFLSSSSLSKSIF